MAQEDSSEIVMSEKFRMTMLGKVAESVIATSPAEGGADAASLGYLAKILQKTPPPTNVPTQGQ